MKKIKPLTTQERSITYYKGNNMAEPVSSTGVAVVIKLYGVLAILSVAALLAWLVVIMTRLPRSRSEWVVSLISTALGSITGGAFIVQKYGLHTWAENMYGALALGGLFFISGLPVWAVIRWVFNYVNKREDFDIIQIIKEAKKEIKGDD